MMKKTNLWEIYYDIENLLDELSAYDSYSPYQEMLEKLDNSLSKLYKYFGIRRLKIDIGELKAGEMVEVEQNEAGAWLAPIKLGEKKVVDLYDYMDISPEDMFYE